jgi:NhaP-type Na+/H+ or K+/H+ antiporter
VSTNQILLGVALTMVLAVGAQVAAARLRLPALILLLPLGFVAGALTDVVKPDQLLGPAFEPLVSLSVALILYDAGLDLNLRELVGHHRRVVVRLIVLGVPITVLIAAPVSAWLLHMSSAAALMLGAILVVSGPTVVGPLLVEVRAVPALRRILGWEGALIDPVGGILGAVVFSGIEASARFGSGRRLAEFATSVAVGVAGAAVGSAVLWLVLRVLAVGEVLATTVQFAAVIAVAAACDVVRDDAGLIAAIGMGLAAANLGRLGPQPFFQTLVQLNIGVLFISISATVTPQSLRGVVWPTLGLVAVLVFVVRPVVALVSTLGTSLTRAERAFTGWMAPRGIVAAATASTFAAILNGRGIAGAQRILPVTFLVIVATVTWYGLTAPPVARRLGVTEAE